MKSIYGNITFRVLLNWDTLELAIHVNNLDKAFL